MVSDTILSVRTKYFHINKMSSKNIFPSDVARTVGYLVNAHGNIRAFVLHSYILHYLIVMLADNEGPDQTAWMRRLIWAFSVLIYPETFQHVYVQCRMILPFIRILSTLMDSSRTL